MNNNYIIAENGELYHYGVPGMKWGVRKAEKYRSKASTARKMSKLYEDMGNDAEKQGSKFNTRKYRNTAKAYERRADKMDRKAKQEDLMTTGDRVKRGVKRVASVGGLAVGGVATVTAIRIGKAISEDIMPKLAETGLLGPLGYVLSHS